MKKIVTITLTAIALLFTFQITAQALKGNGNVIEKEYNVTSFQQLNIEGVFNTWISQGEENLVVVEADENLIHLIEVIEENDNLTLQTKKKMKIKKSTKMNVYVTLTDIENMEIAGVRNVKCDSVLNLDYLVLEVNGVGNTSLLINCDQLEAEFSSVGNIDFEGEAVEANFEISGTGNLDASEFEVENLTVENSSIGNVKIYATETLEINSSGIGNLYYKGDAELKNFNVSGIGKVNKM